ncbi:MAG: hypothetical protein H0W87_09420 [Actinobacteria bacterium]|nr:hypothetical protein [Actinomycetota bacterium]
MKRLKIVSGGHAVLPEEIQRRWGTRCVSLEDHGDHVVLRPAPDDATPPEGFGDDIATDNESASLRRRSSGAGF